MNDWLPNSAWLFETGVAIGALILLVLLTRRAVARQFGPRVAYALWLLPVSRCLWPAMTIPTSWLPQWLQPETPEPTQWVERTPAVYETIPTQIPNTSLNYGDIVLSSLPYLWVLGLFAGVAVCMIRHRIYVRHLTATTVDLDPSLKAEADRAARLSGLRATPPIRQSLLHEGPAVTGLLKPIVVLPTDFTERFTPDQRRLALIHEMSHIRRGDLWSASGMMGLRLLNWPNPVAHMAWPAFRADQEAACDATVLRRVGDTERATYAETLLNAATHSGRASPAIGAGLSLSLHHPVKERLMTLGTTTKRHGLARAGLATLLLTGAALTAPLSLADDRDKKDVETSVSIVMEDVKTGDLSKIDSLSSKQTFIISNGDETVGTMTHDEFMEQFGDIIPERFAGNLAGEPGLKALQDGPQSSFISISRVNNEKGESYEVRKENGETRAFRIEADGTRAEIDPDDVDGLDGLEGLKALEGLDSLGRLEGLSGLDALDRPGSIRVGKTARIFLDREGITGSEDGDARVQFYSFSDGDGPDSFTFGSPGNPEIQLRSAETMIDSSARQIERLRQSDDGRSDRDLREAERELKKAQAALEKAQAAMKRRGAE